jgi:hypothetical protein
MMNDDQEERIDINKMPKNLNKNEYPKSVLNPHNLLEQISRLNDKLRSQEIYWEGIVATKIKVANAHVDQLEKRIDGLSKIYAEAIEEIHRLKKLKQ